ncbi:pyridoxal phosphate-dependent decarboxylase family protein [Marivita hallyeonensis]|uniref:Glutamate or tyrosine decarboxylase n=1 Tax=Marivita hallyeonensis TaxID=996342 RepID=A0A1M5NJD7_9RHOB|nr:pyridoxal-dependent decarboxylase [Marivita hallyeonensis]SHG89628.1 Glutamate or tyrosine decarboxylase [Marivita hallyeonensis]
MSFDTGTPDDTANQPTLDPKDWAAFRASAHHLLDACLDRLTSAGEHPWQPVPQDVRDSYRLSEDGADATDLASTLRDQIMPYATGNTHPRFFGWVHGTGVVEGLMSEMVAATMNANCGGRDHGSVYVEREVIDWARRQMGLPSSASGVLVTGTSQATVIALSTARHKVLGADVRRVGNSDHKLTVYASTQVHASTQNALEIMGIGAEGLRLLPSGADGLDVSAMRAQIAEDRANGCVPFAIVGTSGSVDFGTFDDLTALADLARDEDLWLHVDGAFGAWTRLAEDPWRALTDGIDRADSIACDFHKWMFVPYDCGLVLIRDEADHRATFANRPAYLSSMENGLAGGDPWFCDYGTDLSRGNRALKAWCTIRAHGAKGLGTAITANCRQAALMGQLVETEDKMALVAPVVSNLCVFTADATLSATEQSALNTRIAQDLQMRGLAVFSTTTAQTPDGEDVTCLRAAITNHRTQAEDIEIAVQSVADCRDAKL